ncbi:MAG: putative rane protein [Rhizobium sp.]|nr:putative rane protein [Rhizobium sp.]
MMRLIPKEIESLWTLFTAPVIWALHFVVSYGAFSVYCAKASVAAFSFDTLRAALASVTVAALAVIVMAAWLAWRQWGFGVHDPPHDEPTHDSRTLFQGFATLLLSALSFMAVLYGALPLIFIEGCQR